MAADFCWHVIGPDGASTEETEATLRRMIVEGTITKATLVWRPGMAKWELAGDVAGLFRPPPPPDAANQPLDPPPAPDLELRPPPRPKQDPPDSLGLGPTPRTAAQPANEAGNSYIVRHWRGELPLSLSYWVNGVIATLVVSIVAEQLSEAYAAAHPEQTIGIIFWLLLFSIILSVWQIVGIWRSAGRSIVENRRRGKGSALAIVARAAVVLGVVVEAVSIIGTLAIATARLPPTASFQSWLHSVKNPTNELHGASDDIEQKLEAIASFAALKRVDPPAFSQAVNGWVSAIRKGKNEQEAMVEARRPMLDMANRLKWTSSDKTEIALATVLAREAFYLSGPFPGVCVDIVNAAPERGVPNSAFLSNELQQEDAEVLASIIEGPLEGGVSVVATEQDAKTEMARIWADIRSKGVDLSAVGTTPVTVQDKRASCIAFGEFFIRVAMLPVDKAGPLMRFLEKTP